MAYTYDDFVAAANNAGIMNQLSERDLTVARSNPEYGMSMLGLLQDISGATTEEQRLLATEAANQMRKNYGVYNTGSTAADYNYASSYGSTIDDLLGQINDYGSFSYDGQDSYQQLLDSIVNQQPFSYDLQSDPSWGSYKKAYMREGDRASANALAQASAASGGRASSYAMTAAQQAGNYYAGQLADIIPTLEQNAYARYLSDFSNRLSSLGAIENDRAFDYQNWMNEYNMLQNSLGNYQGQDATDYQRYLDAYNQAHQAEQDRLAQEQLAYENALASYQTLGYATPEVAKILGIKAGSSGGGGTGSGGGGGTGGGGGGNTTTEVQLDEPKGDAGSGDATVDMNSVIQLGYGPISEARLAELVASGEVEMYQEGNVIRFKKAEQPQTPNLPGSSLWNFTQNQMNKANSSTKSNSSAKSGTSKTSNTSSTKKKATGGAGRGSAAGGLKYQHDRVALLM